MIIDTTPDRPRVIGEVDLFAAQTLVHEDAIYLHESVQFHVDRLDWDERKAYVRRVDVDHYTQADRAVTLKPLDVFAEAPSPGGRRRHGEVMVASLATIYKKLKFVTNENLGWGRIHLPEIELQTTAYWLTAEGVRDRWRRDELDVALLGSGRAIQTVASVLLMVDPRDLGLVTQVRSPHAEEPTIYLYESVPGGIGLSERLWERHDDLIAAAADLIRSCGCDAGCPACTGPRLEPEIDARALSLRLLDELGASRPVADVHHDRPAGAARPAPGPLPDGDRQPGRGRPGPPGAVRDPGSQTGHGLVAGGPACLGRRWRGPSLRRRRRRLVRDVAPPGPGGSRAAGGTPRTTAAGRAAPLPRHGDHGARDGRRDRRVPRRRRLVDRRRVPPGPVARPGSRR